MVDETAPKVMLATKFVAVEAQVMGIVQVAALGTVPWAEPEFTEKEAVAAE